MAERQKVRIVSLEDDERWWGEHVEGDIYKSLNHALSAAPLALPEGYDMAPMHKFLEGYPGPDQNGKSFRVCWGHLVRCTPVSAGVVRVAAIVGWEDETKSAE